MDPYDPDAFDWGDESTPEVPQYEDEEKSMTDFITAAIEVHEAKFGWTWIKKADVKEKAKKLYRAKVIMGPEKQKVIEDEWPEYNFVWDHASKHHDHPVSHMMTELNYLEMVQDYVKADVPWIDLFGNSGHAQKYKTKSVVLYQMNSPKDFIRYQYNRPQDLPLNFAALCDKNSALGRIKDVTVVHALYYMSMEDIAKILHTQKGRRIKALVHRHPETAGFLNGGELEYTVDVKGVVTQTNVLTGEKYVHPSLEAMFHQSSAKTSAGGVAWTIRKAGGDAFFIDLVGCDNAVADAFVPLFQLKPETRVVVEVEGVKTIQFLHWVWVTYNPGNKEVVLHDTGLLRKLRLYVAGKPRTPQLMKELGNYARRLTNAADIISIHGGGAHKIGEAQLVDYTQAAFYMDVAHELEVAIAFAKKNEKMVSALNAYYEKGKVPGDAVSVTKAAWKIGNGLVKGMSAVDKGNAAVGGMLFDAVEILFSDQTEKTRATMEKAKADLVAGNKLSDDVPAPVATALSYLGGSVADHMIYAAAPYIGLHHAARANGGRFTRQVF